MTRARDIASATTPNANAALLATFPHKNLIINGAMQVAQRGNSTGVTSTGYYGPDRYQLTLSNLGTWSVSQSSTAPSGFGNSYKLEATTADASPAAGDYAIFLQKIEGQNLQQLKKGTSSAESVTLSFWVRSSKTGTYIIELFDEDNNRSISASYTISSANTFEYKTLTFVGDTTGALNNDNGTSLEVIWYLAAGSTYTSGTLQTSWGTRTAANQAVGQVNMADTANATWFITGVQLEVGSTATPFEHRSFAEEWDRCQRYCTVYNVGGANTHGQNLVSPNHTVPGAAGHVDVGNRAEWFMSYPVKRSQPTITVTDPTNMRWIANGNVVVDANGSVTFPVGTGHQNANVFQGVPSSISTSSVPEGWLYKGSGTNPVITIDAEL